MISEDIIGRCIAGEPVDVLARESGYTIRNIRVAISRSGRGGLRRSAMDEACREVAEEWASELSAATGVDIMQRTRKAAVAKPRQALMLALHRDGHSLPAIAIALGMLDHTTVLHGVRVAERCPKLSLMAQLITEGQWEAIAELASARMAS